MPMWLLECLLQNKVPTIPITKISFVLLPYNEPDGEQLPELLNTYVADCLTLRPTDVFNVQCSVETHRQSVPPSAQAHEPRMFPHLSSQTHVMCSMQVQRAVTLPES